MATISSDSDVYTLVIRYMGYETVTMDDVKIDDDTHLDFEMSESGLMHADVMVVGKKNRESENMLLMEQRKSLVATQAVDAKELSRKGVGDASDDHSLRLGASKTYTLPQAKELAPFRYCDVSFSSEGNKNLVPSDVYNIDLRWE